MKYTIIVIVITLLIASPCTAEKSIDDIIEDDVYAKGVNLPYNQEHFFKERDNCTEIILKLGKDIDAISPAIGQLKNLKSIVLIGIDRAIYNQRHNVIIPLELLTLPHLKTLKVYGLLNLHLLTGLNAIKTKSKIEQVVVQDWEKNSIPFLGNLPKVRQLILLGGHGGKLPSGFDRLHNLRELHIANAEPLALGESLCGFTNLERLELSTPLRSTLPRCFERLTRLRSVTMASCRQEPLPDKGKIYFPIALASLPNLKELTLWANGWIEMPKTEYGFNKLQKLSVIKNPNGDMYNICLVHAEQTSNIDESNLDQLNLDAVVDYPELQKIIVNARIFFKGSTIKTADHLDYDPVRGIRRFMDIVDVAWKQGKLPSLKQIDMWDRDDGAMNAITVWKRPSSRDKNGTMLPTNDMNWMLKKEREKTSSSQ